MRQLSLESEMDELAPWRSDVNSQTLKVLPAVVNFESRNFVKKIRHDSRTVKADIKRHLQLGVLVIRQRIHHISIFNGVFGRKYLVK